mmetsp:Transcript_4419/g.12830  ORF Transcript_4419/g.12830 Transcript_4419/m.12830 type:complete len:186 (+) Transcript_4419:531-1088(+)
MASDGSAVKVIRTPRETDGQLAFMSRAGKLDFVLAEDVDLVALGCLHFICKLSLQDGKGKLFDLSQMLDGTGARDNADGLEGDDLLAWRLAQVMRKGGLWAVQFYCAHQCDHSNLQEVGPANMITAGELWHLYFGQRGKQAPQTCHRARQGDWEGAGGGARWLDRCMRRGARGLRRPARAHRIWS